MRYTLTYYVSFKNVLWYFYVGKLLYIYPLFYAWQLGICLHTLKSICVLKISWVGFLKHWS